MGAQKQISRYSVHLERKQEQRKVYCMLRVLVQRLKAKSTASHLMALLRCLGTALAHGRDELDVTNYCLEGLRGFYLAPSVSLIASGLAVCYHKFRPMN